MDSILSYVKTPENDYYLILGCDELSTEEQIYTEYKNRVRDCHPDKQPGDSGAAARFSRLQKAKEILTNADTRKQYDQWRGSGIAMSFETWLSKKDSVHMSMHWATPKKKEAMIEPAPNTRDRYTRRTDFLSDNHFTDLHSQEDSSNDILRKFRNYDI